MKKTKQQVVEQILARQANRRKKDPKKTPKEKKKNQNPTLNQSAPITTKVVGESEVLLEKKGVVGCDIVEEEKKVNEKGKENEDLENLDGE